MENSVIVEPMPVVERPGLIEEVAAAILAGKSLADIAKAMGAPPLALAAWLNKHHAKDYADALALRDDLMEREALAIADNAKPKTVNVARLRVDTRLKLAGRGNGEAQLGGQARPFEVIHRVIIDAAKRLPSGD